MVQSAHSKMILEETISSTPLEGESLHDERQSRLRMPESNVRPPLADATDGELLSAYHQGDEHAFAELVQRYEKPLTHFLMGRGVSRPAAEDLTQVTFMRLAMSETIDMSKASLKSYIFTAAHHAHIDELRSGRRRHEHLFTDCPNTDPDLDQPYVELADTKVEAPDAHALAEENASMVRAAVESLEPQFRTIMTLRELSEASYEEIATELKIPKGTVKSRLHTARREFKRELTDRIED